MTYLFSFSGRINRAKLWLFVLISIGVGIAYGILFLVLVGFSAFTAQAHNGAGLLAAGGSLLFMALLALVLQIALLVAWLALATKRLHDRNKGAVWLIPFIIIPTALDIYYYATLFTRYGLQHITEANADPVLALCSLAAFVLGIWGFVELYCLRGTVGDNRFGPDPLAGRV